MLLLAPFALSLLRDKQPQMHCLLPSAACRRLLPVAAVLAALLLLALPYSYQACASVKQQPRELAVLNLHCSSNWDLGAAVGIATQPLIRDRYAASAALHRCLDYVCTPEGRRTLGQMLDLHQRKYPRLVDELKGLAAGADVPFEQVLLCSVTMQLTHKSCCRMSDEINGGQRLAGTTGRCGTTAATPLECAELSSINPCMH